MKSWQPWVLGLAACALIGMSVQKVHAQQSYFDWLAEGDNGNNPTPGMNYVTTPTLSDATESEVFAYLTAQQLAGQPLALKIRAGTPLGAGLSPATISAIYNNFDIKYTFIDYEGPNAEPNTAAVVSAIKSSTMTGPAFTAGTAFIGDYAIATIPNDPSKPTTGTTYVAGNSPVENYSNITDFRNSGVNMSNEELYPGDSSFRNPIYGSTPTGKGSNAPNILSALFTLPIERLSVTSQNMGTGQLNIPYISRFNNWDNPTFSNSTYTSGTLTMPSFNTSAGLVTLGGNPMPSAGQLLSRDDFEALVLHYRMRGATSFQLLDPGVVGYTQAQEEADAYAGWNESLVANVLAGTNGRSANLGNTITVDGTLKTIENAGVVWSAVTNNNAVGPQLAVLVSNMDTTTSSHTVTFNSSINGATLSYTTGALGAGTHTILRFDKTGSTWSLQDIDPLFVGDPSSMTSRDGIGIPEPASLSLVGLGMMGVLCRRRRNKA